MIEYCDITHCHNNEEGRATHIGNWRPGKGMKYEEVHLCRHHYLLITSVTNNSGWEEFDQPEEEEDD